MDDLDREYDYKPKWTNIILVAVFFGLCAVALGAKAAGNDCGVVINRIIELGPDGATAFYWALCASSVAFVAVAAFLTYHRVAPRQRLTFGPTALTVPTSRWSALENEAPLHSGILSAPVRSNSVPNRARCEKPARSRSRWT